MGNPFQVNSVSQVEGNYQNALAAQLRNQEGQQTIQQNNLQLRQGNQADADRQAIIDSWKVSGGDRNKFLQDITQRAPHLVEGLRQQMAMSDITQRKAQLDQANALIDATAQRVGGLKAINPEVRPQAWGAVRQQLLQLGHSPQELPEQYPGDQWVEATLAQGMSAKDQVAAAAKQQELGLTAKRDAATAQHQTNEEALTKRGQDITAATAKRGQDLQYGSFSATIPSGTTGAQALLMMPPAMASTVQAIGDGKVDFATVTSRMPPAVKANLISAVMAYKPDFNQANFSIQKGAGQYFAYGKGAEQAQAFNTTLAHFGTLNAAVDALQNGNVQAINQISNAFRSQFGGTAPTSFAVVKNIAADEFAKAATGANVAQGDREKADALFSSAQSPQQLKQAIAQGVELLKGKMSALEYTRQRAGNPNAPLISPEAQQGISNVGGGTAAPPGLSNIHVNPQTGEKVGWNGTQWVKF